MPQLDGGLRPVFSLLRESAAVALRRGSMSFYRSVSQLGVLALSRTSSLPSVLVPGGARHAPPIGLPPAQGGAAVPHCPDWSCLLRQACSWRCAQELVTYNRCLQSPGTDRDCGPWHHNLHQRLSGRHLRHPGALLQVAANQDYAHVGGPRSLATAPPSLRPCSI